MPYDINKPEDLPGYVQDLSAKKRRQWVHVFNSARAKCMKEDDADPEKCEKSAFAQANAAVKAGRRVRGLRVAQLRKLRKELDDLLHELDDVLGWAEYEDQQDGIAYGFPLGDVKQVEEERERCRWLRCNERPTIEILHGDDQHSWLCAAHSTSWSPAADIVATKKVAHGIARKRFTDEHSPRVKAADIARPWETVEKWLSQDLPVLGRPKIKGVKFAVRWDGDAIELEAEGEMAAPSTWELSGVPPFTAKGTFTAEPEPHFWLHDTADKEVSLPERLEALKALQLPEAFTVLAHRPIRSCRDLEAVSEWAVRRPHSTGIIIRPARSRAGEEVQGMDVKTLFQQIADGLAQDEPDIEKINQAVQDIKVRLGFGQGPSEDEIKATREEQREARDARAGKYKISAKEGGALTPPAGYPAAESQYGDPVNFRYPADADHARPALSYFNQEDQREDGGYNTKEWGIIGKRLAKLVSSHLPATYEYQGGKLQQKEEEGKAASMSEKERRVRDAWYEKFREVDAAGNVKHDLWVKDVFDDDVPTHLVVETPDGLFSYTYAFTADDEIEFGEPVKGEMVFRPTGKSQPAAIKILREDDTGVEVGGHLLLWGDAEKKDLAEEYFTPETNLWLDAYKSAPCLFHHGLDEHIGLNVIGHRVKAVPDDIGVWVEHWLDKSKKYWAMVKPLLEAEGLYYSPGSASHLVECEDDGELKSFPVVEDTMTLIPCQHRLLPVEQIKAVYEAADIKLPDALTMQQDDEDRATALRIAELEQQLYDIET